MTSVVFRTDRLLGGLLLSLLLCGCIADSTSKGHEGEWLAPTPALEQQIHDQIARLPWTHGTDRVEVIGWLAGVGEPAYESLLDLCLDPRPDVAGSALAALGATGDSRLVEHIRKLDWAPDLPREVLFERSRAMVRLGDWSQIEYLIQGLSADELWARAWSIQALEEATKQSFGFDPQGEPEERAEAVGRWQTWIDSRRVEGVLGA